MAIGTVKWFDTARWYGFIPPASGEMDGSVHIRAAERTGQTTLQEGRCLDYELQQGRSGRYSAENLKLV